MGGPQPRVMTPQQQLTQYKKQLREMRNCSIFDVRQLPGSAQMFDSKDFLMVSKVQGITDPYYKQLNDELVYPYKKQRVKHKVYFNSGEVRETKVTQVPVDCVPVLSDKILGLPPKYTATDTRLGYLDFSTVAGEDEVLHNYIYVIPKENLLPIKRTALIAVRTPRKNHYGGYKVVLRNGHTVYLLIVDYTYSLYENAKYNVIVAGRGQLQLRMVEEYIQYLAERGIGHSLDEWEGHFCLELPPENEFERNTLTLDKMQLSPQDIEDLTAQEVLEGLE